MHTTQVVNNLCSERSALRDDRNSYAMQGVMKSTAIIFGLVKHYTENTIIDSNTPKQETGDRIVQ